MLTAEIRRRWLNFFSERGHTVVPSASLISDDPTLLFTVAGMVPFVPYLTGVVPAPFPRATSVQKCIRTVDIEEVGKTPRHGTFFQMNGNFSFGDYFKEQAIHFAWELLFTPESQGGLGFNEKDFWFTVYEGDDEAYECWTKLGASPSRIQRMSKEENFWSTGRPGPAGPDSEIFFDRGPAYGIDGGPATDDDRYVELWNLVFMQYLRGENIGDGKNDFEILGDLPRKNIDTGMGLERVAFLKQGVENMYEIDQVRPVLDCAAEIAGKRYGAEGGHLDDVHLRVVADHVRSSLMLVSDGVTASNDGRGYILRRLLRRVVRSMRLMGVDTAVFPELFAASRDAMKAAYPEVETDYERISGVVFAEEETFLRTLAGGTTILDTAITQTKAERNESLPGDTAFLLHDTFGFPIELTLEIAEESGLSVDRDVFERLMAEQRARAKADARAKKGHLADLNVYSPFRALGETVFTGYADFDTDSEVLGLFEDGVSVTNLTEGHTGEVILRETSLYAEAGGQDADQGSIVGPGYELEVLDVQRPVKGLVSHTVHVAVGEVSVGATATSKVDRAYRHAASQAHSATHLVHAGLRQLLGSSAHQSGSYNRAGYMRLDFAWNKPLSAATRSELEDIANGAIRDRLAVTTRELPLNEAKELGAMALFGEKYGDIVRMVEIGGPWSRELCGGTHVGNSAEVGLINLIGESSVGSTSRRVESLVGVDAFKDFAVERAIVNELSASLKTPRERLPERINDLVGQLKAAEKKIAEFSSARLLAQVPALLESAHSVGSVHLVARALGVLGSADELRRLTTVVRDRLGSDAAVVVLVALVGDESKPSVVAATNQAARDAGVKAGALVSAAAACLGGRGGGKDDIAQGGGSNASAFPEALKAVASALDRSPVGA